VFEKLAKIIYVFLKILDLPFKVLFKKSFLIWFKDLIEKDANYLIEVSKKNLKICLFNPSYLTNWLYEDFLTKEPETIQWIDNFDKEKDIVFWDIGANLGLYSIYAALNFEKIKIISFEPSTSNLRILSRNIYLNNLQHKIKIIQLPLGNKEMSFSDFRESIFEEGASNNAFDDRINFEGRSFNEKNSYQILGTTANYILKNNITAIPDYVKIDVDGLEHNILIGFFNYLKHPKIKKIQIELNENFEEQKKMVFEILLKNNFKYKSKKRNENLSIYKIKKFNKIYNYYFEK
tara:strand:- start:684 stop:1556 length:873 start_codon:yes stop_codon:yes gene_type:complete